MHLLLVEDDPALGEVVRRGLQAAGYTVRWERTGEGAFDQALAGVHDVVVLDVMLPDWNGLDLLRDLRREGLRAPVLCLTARGGVDDRVGGLDAGADDYLTKPFAFAELLARLRALLRRSASDRGAPALSAGNLRLDTIAHQVLVASRDLAVPPREFDLLEYLLRNAGTVLSRDQIVERVWGPGVEPKGNVADATVSRLRRRLVGAGWDGAIVAVPGLGYRLLGGDAEARGQERRP
jgi:two-component system OmpR family response regulator